MSAQQKILIVDDDVDFTDATAAILEAAGFAVLTANDGPTGLELARAARPDLIVLDIMMSHVLEGLSVGAQIQADALLEHTPILMVSAIARSEHIEQFPTDQPIPGQFFLAKPVPAEKLVETVRWMLGERREAPTSS